MKRWLILLLGLLATAAPAQAGGPRMLLGATEDNVRQPTLTAAKANMDLLRLAGFTAVRVSQVWAPGQRSLSESELAPLANAVDAAKLSGVEVVLTVTQFGSATTPLTDEQQADFSAFTASLARDLPAIRSFVIGNEPNLNRYWLPQYNADGSDAAAPAYLRLLAHTYDALKAVDPTIEVLGLGLSPRGSDNPTGIRQTHSPTLFLRDLGAAYRASGRTEPIMDALALHPYEDDSSVAPNDGIHPNTTSIALADYAKLVALLEEAFGGTAQLGATLPIVYDEFGVETQIPAAKAALYTGTEPATIHPADEATQAEYYRQALELAFCQPTVTGIFLFHSVDESDLDRWQSGVYYADGTPKASLAPTRAALAEVRRGVIARCAGLHLRPKPVVLPHGLRTSIRCDIDCTWTARLVRLPHSAVATRRGTAIADTPVNVAFKRPARAGRFHVELEFSAPLNPAPKPVLKVTPTFRVM